MTSRRPPPPPAPLGFTRDQYREYAGSLTWEELVIAAGVFAREVRMRQGAEKFQPAIPPHLVN